MLRLDGNNLFIDSNHFYNNWGKPIHCEGNNNVTISNNNFESHYDYDVFISAGYDISLFESPCAIEITDDANDVLIEKNRIFDWPGSGIVAGAITYNTTIRDNLIQSASDSGIYMIQDAYNYTITGNLLANNPIGLNVSVRCENLTIYKNAFVNNTIQAANWNATARGVTWDNGTYGNLWNEFIGSGSDIDDNWVIDSSTFTNSHNVSDDYPAMMIGDFAPSSGTWTIDTPHMFYLKDVGDIYDNIVVEGIAGVLGLVFSDMNIESGQSITLSDDSTFFLVESSIQVRTLSGTYNFYVNDIFNFMTIDASISNVTTSITIETRFFRSTGTTYHEIAGMEVSMYAYYDFNFQGAIPVYLHNNVFTNFTGDIIIDREVDFSNNSITFETPSSDNWVNLGTQHSYAVFDDPEHYVVDGNHVTGGRLNLTAGFAYCSAVDNYAEQGFRVDVGEGAHDSYFNISGNTADLNEMYLQLQMLSGSSSTIVDMNNNTLDSGTFTLYSNSGWYGDEFNMLYTTHNSGLLDINNALLGNIQYLNHVSGATDMLNVQGATFNHCYFGGDLDILNSGDFALLNSEIWGDVTLSYVDGSCINSTNFYDSQLSITHTDDMVVAHNTFINYSDPGTAQIYLAYAVNAVIYDNDFVNVTAAVKMELFTDFCVIEGNTIDLNGYIGIDVYTRCDNNTIKDNILANGSYGVYIRGDFSYNSWNSTITGNEFTNFSNAIRIEKGNYHSITYNNISNVSGTAVYVEDASYPTITHNTIYDVGVYGIHVNGGNITLSHNRLTNCSSYGVYLPGGVHYYLTMQNNTVTYCQRGVYSPGFYSNATIFNNTIVFNDEWGMYFHSLDDSQLWLNYFYGNADGSIYIWWGTGNQLDNGSIGNFYPEYRGAESATHWIGSDAYEVRGANNAVRGTDNYPIMGMGDIPAIGDPFPSGDWVIDELTIILGVTKSIDGDIIITSTGNLTLLGTEIEFTTGGSYYSIIRVMIGGSLKATDGAVFTADQVTQTYGLSLQTDSTLYMHDVTIDRCGYPDNFQDPAFKINVTDVSLSNMTFSNCITGVVVRTVDGLSVTDLHFVNCDYGISIGSDDVLVDDLTFDNVLTAIEASLCQNITIRNCDFNGTVNYALYFAAVDGSHIYNNKFVDISTCIRLNSLCDNNEIYMNFFSGSTQYLLDSGTGNTMHNGTHGNFYLDYTGYDADGDLIGDSNHVFNTGVDYYPLMVWGSWPTASSWDIVEDTWCLNTSYTLHSDLEIFDGAMFYVQHARFTFEMTFDLQYSLIVNTGGTLRYLDGEISTSNPSYRFSIDANEASNIWMDGVACDGAFHLQIATNSTYLHELTLKNGHVGIEFANALNLCGFNLEDITFSHLDSYAIYAPDVHDITIRNCSFIDTQYGVYAISCSNILIVDADFVGTSQQAIYFTSCTDTTVRNCTFDLTSSSYGIYLIDHGYGYLNIEDSVFYDVYRGINIQNGADDGLDVTIQNVTIEKVANIAILARFISSLDVHNCSFPLDGGKGIQIELGVLHFEIHDTTGFNGSDFLHLSGSSIGSVYNCEILNFTIGIANDNYAITGSNVNVTDCFFYGCEHGVHTHGEKMGVFHNLFEYGDTAIITTQTTNLTIANNTIRYHAFGISSLEGPVSLSIYGNFYFELEYDAISFSDHVVVGYIYNESIDTCRFGVMLYHATNVTGYMATIENAERGVLVDHTSNTSLSDFTIDSCDLGVDVWYSENLTLRDFVISNCDDGITFAINSEATSQLDIDSSNQYDGKPIYYIHGETGTFYDGLDTNHLTLAYCSHVTVNGSIIHEDQLSFIRSDNCSISNSSIESNIYILYSEDILVYGNLFYSLDTEHFDLDGTTSNITMTLNEFLSPYFFNDNAGWNLNKSTFGNYWFDYSGTDADMDGIGDTPHNAGGTNIDYYPLISRPRSIFVFVEIDSPNDGVYVSGEVDIQFTTTLITGVLYSGTPSVSVILELNGTTIWTGSDGPQTYVLDTSSYPDGYYWYRVRASSDSNDFTKLGWIHFDNSGPVIDIDSPASELYTSDSSVNVEFSADDTMSDITWIATLVNGTIYDNRTINYSHSDVYFTVSFIEEGSYNITIVAANDAGSITIVERIMVIDWTAPVISTPADVEMEYGGSASISWTVTEENPAYYNITIDGESYLNRTLDGSSIQYDLPILDVGWHYLEIRVYDRAGNYWNDYVTITVTESTTSSTTGTDTSTTSSIDTGTGSTTPLPNDPLGTIVIVLGVVVGAVVVIVVIVVMKKNPTS